MPGILIADDNPNIRQLLRTFIETQTGLTVCGEAENGAQAVEKAKELKPDIILLDLVMPMLNGIQAASVIRKDMPRVWLILFSMQVDSLGRAITSAIGIDFVLSKEESISKLSDYLEQLERLGVTHETSSESSLPQPLVRAAKT
jgi:DNA-binding NarL/FixJ family response regulator